MTGSSPSTGSSSTSSSGRSESASQNAACFFMPREKRRMGILRSMGKASARRSKRSESKPGYTPL